MTPVKRTPNGKGLTVSANKSAILIRLPNPVIAEIDRLAHNSHTPRTKVLYHILSRSSSLGKVRSHLEALCKEKETESNGKSTKKPSSKKRAASRPKSKTKPPTPKPLPSAS